MKKLLAYLLMVATCYGVGYQVKLSDLNNAEWVEVAPGDYRILWSDIGGVTPPAGVTPVMEWLMGANGDESNVLVGSSPNAITGTVSGATWNKGTNGMFATNGWYEFGLSDGDYLQCDDISPAGLTTQGTFLIMIRLDNNVAQSLNYWGEWTDGSGLKMAASLGGSNATYDDRIHIFDGAFQRISSTWSDAYDGKWVCLAHRSITDNSQAFGAAYGNSDFYLNGVSQGLTSRNWEFTWETNTIFRLGERYDSNTELGGGIGWFKHYDTLLTDAEVASNSIVMLNSAGIISDYLADNTNTYWQDTVFYAGHNNILQDGSVNVNPVITASSPSPKGTTDNGWYEYDGNGNRTHYAHISDYSMTTQFTMSVWLNIDGHTGGGVNGGGVIGKWSATVGERAYALYTQGSDTSMHFGLNGTEIDLTAGIKTGEWNHWMGVYTGTNAILYSNGVEVAQSAITGNVYTNTARALCVGYLRDDLVGFYTDGKIDEPWVLNRGLSYSEVTNYYDTSKTALGF